LQTHVPAYITKFKYTYKNASRLGNLLAPK